MPHYIRAHVPGGSYFFTVAALLERRRRLLMEHVDALRAAFATVAETAGIIFVSLLSLFEPQAC